MLKWTYNTVRPHHDDVNTTVGTGTAAVQYSTTLPKPEFIPFRFVNVLVHTNWQIAQWSPGRLDDPDSGVQSLDHTKNIGMMVSCGCGSRDWSAGGLRKNKILAFEPNGNCVRRTQNQSDHFSLWLCILCGTQIIPNPDVSNESVVRTTLVVSWISKVWCS